MRSSSWVVVLSLNIVSCRVGDPSPPPATTPPANAMASAPAIDATESTANDEPAGGMLGLVVGNVASTDLSALVTITAARIEAPGGGPPPAKGYVDHVYDVAIVTCLHGCGSVKGFTFAQLAEAGVPTQQIGESMIVSVCRDAPGKYHTPDVGYFIPASELAPSAVGDLVAKPPPRAASVCTKTP